LRGVQADWQDIEDARDKRTAESYQTVLDQLPGVTAKMSDLKARYERLIAPTATPKPQAESDPTNWIILIIVLALGAYGFWMYRKKQQEESGESQDEHGH